MISRPIFNSFLLKKWSITPEITMEAPNDTKFLTIKSGLPSGGPNILLPKNITKMYYAWQWK